MTEGRATRETYETRFVYTRSLARRAFVQSNWHDNDVFWLMFGTGFVLVAVVAVAVPSWRPPCLFIAGLCCFPFLMLVTEYFRVGSSNREIEGPITVVFDERGVTVFSERGSANASWAVYSKMYLTRRFVFLLRNRPQPFFVPRELVTEAALAFIDDQIRAVAPRFDEGVPPA